ncbi:hypothetical protein I8920_03920 [Curtobacterium sp. YC1]|uniref:hypothetical protein n=1 Tax=Curtobacterium sp. YC1 TaxID=2795488 RepID=UPI0018E55E60|nr:hypothetical protein [Curtobacterium sp. YC1]QQD76915.1 hypothetical protein I8920_03920 [Curtobacterium sp. YC1]
MSLDALDAQLDDLREQASRLQKYTQQEKKDIAANVTLSEEGKRHQTEEVVAGARTRANALRDKEVQLVKNHLRSLETQLDAKIGYGATDMIAFRDAQERADRLDDADDAARLMGLAIRSNDRTLAHALFRKSIDKGWNGVTQQFTAEHPEAATTAKEIQILEQHLNQSFSRTMAYMV